MSHHHKVRRIAVVGVVTVAPLAVSGTAFAHNAGHVFLPSGRCLQLGSFRDAPLVGADKHELDLVPETPASLGYDEYGVSFVGFMDVTGQRSAPIYPGPCPS
jgi:hypothetical protein